MKISEFVKIHIPRHIKQLILLVKKKKKISNDRNILYQNALYFI
jgi:hypothetical protein